MQRAKQQVIVQQADRVAGPGQHGPGMRGGGLAHGCGDVLQFPRMKPLHATDFIRGQHDAYAITAHHQHAVVARAGHAGGRLTMRFQTEQAAELHAHQQFAAYVHHAKHDARVPVGQRVDDTAFRDFGDD